ncbi:hypothetical protein E4T56_gene2677 [Termitomyces sp. T112]|nr:hypothetical protein E4T56_gene2677 [Termitomyces sp. T112]
MTCAKEACKEHRAKVYALGIKEGEKEAENVEMREMTPLVTVAEVKPVASDMEVEGKEFKAGAVGMDEDEDEGKEEAKV